MVLRPGYLSLRVHPFGTPSFFPYHNPVSPNLVRNALALSDCVCRSICLLLWCISELLPRTAKPKWLFEFILFWAKGDGITNYRGDAAFVVAGLKTGRKVDDRLMLRSWWLFEVAVTFYI